MFDEDTGPYRAQLRKDAQVRFGLHAFAIDARFYQEGIASAGFRDGRVDGTEFCMTRHIHRERRGSGAREIERNEEKAEGESKSAGADGKMRIRRRAAFQGK